MRHFKLYLSLLLLMAFGMVGCQDDFDSPPVIVPEAKQVPNTKIEEIKKLMWETSTNYVNQIGTKESGEDYIIGGRVISSDATGNIYKSLVIQDETGALAMSINANSLYTTYRVGQEIVINLTEMYAGKYAGLFQLGYPDADATKTGASFMPLEFFQLHVELNKLPDVTKIDTISTVKDGETIRPLTFADLDQSPAGLQKWQSQLVRFDDVEFEGGGKLTFSETDATTNRNITQNGQSLIVRTSNYASFKSAILPTGKGSICGIISYYQSSPTSGGTWQLLLRSTDDCIGFGIEEGTKANPYLVEKAIALQGKGVSGWMTGYIVGAVAPNVTKVEKNEDIEWGAPTTLGNTVVIGESPDTKDFKKSIIVPLPANSPLRAQVNLVDNPSVYKKQLKIEGTFATVMGTYGLTDNSGSADEFELEGQVDPEGNGTEDSPYTVTQIKNGASGTGVWIKGYIVGWVDGKALDENGAKFTTPATVQTNVLLAASADVKDYTKCIPIQLPTGDVRSAINLQSNPTNLGKTVSLFGNIAAYFGTSGLKETSKYKIDGDTPTPPGPTDPVTSLNQTFTGITSISQLAGWKSVAVTGDKNWYFQEYSGITSARMTGYNGTNPPFDAWLITPALNVADAKEKMLSFETQVNAYGSTTTKFEVYALSSNDPATATKTKLSPTLPSAPADGYSDWVNSGNINLSSYGNTVYIGFRFYATTDANYATWCLTNVKFNAGEAPDPEPEPEPGDKGGEDNPFSVADVQGSATGTGVWTEGYIVGWIDGMTFNEAGTKFTAPATSQTNIVIAASADVKDYTKCIPVQLPAGTVRTGLNLQDNPANLGKKVKLKGNLEKYFGGKGIKSVTEYKF